MPKRVPLSAIGITREGKTLYPTIGEPFDFTASELDDIRALEKITKNSIVRKIINEDSGDEGGSSGDQTGKPLGDMTIPELKAEATRLDLDLGTAKTKPEILALVEAAVAAADEDL